MEKRAKVQGNYFLIVPAVPGNGLSETSNDRKKWRGVITLGHLPQWDFLLCRAGQRAGLLQSACPTGWGLYKGSDR